MMINSFLHGRLPYEYLKPFENAFLQAFKIANINPHKTVSRLRFFKINFSHLCVLIIR